MSIPQKPRRIEAGPDNGHSDLRDLTKDELASATGQRRNFRAVVSGSGAPRCIPKKTCHINARLMSDILSWLFSFEQTFQQLGWTGVFAYAGAIVLIQVFCAPLS